VSQVEVSWRSDQFYAAAGVEHGSVPETIRHQEDDRRAKLFLHALSVERKGSNGRASIAAAPINTSRRLPRGATLTLLEETDMDSSPQCG
jgi:hypothetical protein